MGRWSAVSDYDYDDELNGRTHAGHERNTVPRCRTCGDRQQVVYNGDGDPVFVRCDACARERARAAATRKA